MSRPVIEARSLSSLTSLASNPPSYPRNPTHGKQEPLVLYIARVPGSRDVFLSPMKPREKVVTAEDVQNSLYFVHMDNPEDARYISTPSYDQSGEQQQSAPTEHPHPPLIQRKAVPNTSTISGASIPPDRKPAPGTLSPSNDYNNGQSAAAAKQSHLNSNYLAPDYTARRSLDSAQHSMENERRPPSVRRHSEQARSLGTSLTLIRRDPSSGAQWNIARVHDPPVLNASSSAFNDGPNLKPVGAPLYIDIMNPGYSRFLNFEHNLAPQDAPGKVRENPNVFHRRLWMEGAELPHGGFGHQRIKSRDSSGSPRHSLEGLRRAPVDTRAPTTSQLPSEHQSHNTNAQTGRQTAFRGYVFMSPWNGRCEFSTGAGGASLKCQHVVPGLQGAAPLAMPVSELRFNLPVTTKASTPRSEDTSKRSSFFHRPRHNRHGSNVSDVSTDRTMQGRGSFDRMDLSLGQEYAGGGFGGKDAKLGKLIIEDEGLKMVDLLVAANIALWWRAYDKYETRVKTNRASFS